MTIRTKTFVFDLDGVLANTEHRLPLLNEGPDIFFKAMADDTPIEATRNIYSSLCPDFPKVVLTGRPERFRGATEEWINEHIGEFEQLIMRPDGCPLTVMDFKVETIEKLIKTRYIMAVIEDNPLTAQYLRENTYAPVLLVSSGYYDPAGFGHDPREDKRW